MNVGEGEIWQIAAGDTDRSYADLCLRWGVVLFGPGYRGMWRVNLPHGVAAISSSHSGHRVGKGEVGEFVVIEGKPTRYLDG